MLPHRDPHSRFVARSSLKAADSSRHTKQKPTPAPCPVYAGEVADVPFQVPFSASPQSSIRLRSQFRYHLRYHCGERSTSVCNPSPSADGSGTACGANASASSFLVASFAQFFLFKRPLSFERSFLSDKIWFLLRDLGSLGESLLKSKNRASNPYPILIIRLGWIRCPV